MNKQRRLIEQVAFWHGLPVREILGRRRSWPVVAARFDAIAAVYLNCKIDGRRPRDTELGRIFGRDHTTIHQALAKRGLVHAYRREEKIPSHYGHARGAAASPSSFSARH